ncbi:MAG: GNAT family N-acetyltransferase [Bacteroidales bacterium]|jgi:GNAT superfamily N-acetyltransferase|nr:GNAT family N-acetyltransferase [Bacteroidales bacterium]
MKYLTLTQDNLISEHICCAFSDKKCHEGYLLKKKWLSERIHEGYTFLKADVRAKVFIEFGDAEKAWAPINAPGYTFIGCFWVSGQYKGHGYAKALLQQCINDSKGKNGIVVITGNKKLPFLSDAAFFQKHGFIKADIAPPYFELWYLPLKSDCQTPEFSESCKTPAIKNSKGIEVFYTSQCPFTDYYTNEVLSKAAKNAGYNFTAHHIKSADDARAHITAFPLYSVFMDGVFLTHEILSKKRFEKLLG